jgi:hypothetical protein
VSKSVPVLYEMVNNETAKTLCKNAQKNVQFSRHIFENGNLKIEYNSRIIYGCSSCCKESTATRDILEAGSPDRVRQPVQPPDSGALLLR